ncbi:MAG: hypothetical protein Q8M03_05955 [Legionella sp.]|nr:hypothetical protein [Legionella sp.]
MKYKVTKHYIKTKENLIAAFSDFNDAKIFIAKKITQDEVNRTKVLYRIYDDNELAQEFSKDTHEFNEPEDAETYSNAHFAFQVKRQALNSLERIPIACFNDKKDANLFVTGKCSTEDESDPGAIFLIFNAQVLCETINKTILENHSLKDSEASGKATGATLSPLSTRPVPPGGPGNYWVEKSEDDEK